MENPRQPLRIAAIATALALTGGLASCSSDEGDEAPGACLVSSDGYTRALEAAPAQVRLEGETPISDCLTPGQDAGELAQIGEEMIVAATVLNERARQDPNGPPTVQLGYLTGAVERGADDIHADLLRRLDAAARFSPDRQLPAEFERTFDEGYAAGRDSG